MDLKVRPLAVLAFCCFFALLLFAYFVWELLRNKRSITTDDEEMERGNEAVQENRTRLQFNKMFVIADFSYSARLS